MVRNKVIVLGFNHINALGIVRSLGEESIKPICVLYGSKSGMIFSSKYPSIVVHVDTVEEGLKFILDNFLNECLKPIIICSNDETASIIDKNYSKLKNDFYLPNAQIDGRITALMDKIIISEVAEQFGFVSPKSVLIDKNDSIPDDMVYPCFTKSIMTIKGGKKDVFLCGNKVELADALKKVRSDKILLQQYIDKKNEICLQGLSINSGKQIYIPFIEKFFRFTKNEFGGYVYFEKFENQKEEFRNNVHKLIEETQYSGLFSVEFLVDKSNNLFFTEINFRHDGFSYFTTTGGANLPYIWCKSLVNNSLEIEDVLLKDYFTGMNELTDFFQFVRTKKISVQKWINQCIKADSHLLYNKKDLGPLFHTLKSFIVLALNKYLLNHK
ncbi:ATP-grasp domain-containing protein [Marinifilum sp. RC60d5]|uniref:ATP-grasp domain-containing protein n=1 Tax=Marinifilum sp. RC60d5 TaxID=3458414 RepID=UPI004034FD56